MRFSWFALALALLFSARVGAAQGERDDEPRAGAPEHHFERALEDYRAGRYRAAIQALNSAIVLDPNSKDLFFNLALVYEKLGELDRAIVALGRYVELESDPAEVKRATQAIARMRGARAEALSPIPPAPMAVAPPVHVKNPAPAPLPRPSLGIDGWIVGGAALVAGAALAGIVFGVQALALEPEDTKIRADRERARKAEQSARIANVAFSLSLLSGAGTALLWFVRAPESGSSAAAPIGVSLQGAF
jgi:tetratricopeptide (TPR) repeat protein